MTPKRAIILIICLVLVIGGLRIYNQAFRNNVWRGTVAAIRADLGGLAAAQDAYRERAGRYAPDLATLGDSAFQASEGVTVRILEATESRLSAEGTHSTFADDAKCTLLLGDVPGGREVTCSGFVDWLYRPRRAR